MKAFGFRLIFCVVLLGNSCASSRTVPLDGGDRDGSSFAKAIIVNSIKEEYDWMRENYPGSKVNIQSLQFKNKKPYDVLNFTLPDGKVRDFYFDISSFYGKF